MMFLEVFLIGVLCAISPGPDFFIVMKNSLGYGKQVGIASALGIATALTIHAAYTILGLAIMLQTYFFIFKAIQLAGACYLLYLGILSIRSTLHSQPVNLEQTEITTGKKTLLEGFKNGFFCNLLNPKAFLFFLSIFSQFLTPETPKWVEVVYGLEIIIAVGGWFTLLSLAISTSYFRKGYQKAHVWFDRLFGGLLLYFSYKIGKSIFDS